MSLSTRFRDFYESPGESNRLLSIEGIRGVAVLLVFFVHFHALFSCYVDVRSWVFTGSYFLGVIGHTGVDLFFLVSGYLIYGALIRRPVGYLKFMGRRVHRIFPAFITVFFIYLGLSVVFPLQNKIHGSPFEATRYILANLILLPGIFHIDPIISVAWSLSYEFLFYLTIPLLVWLTGTRKWRSFNRVMFFLLVSLISVVCFLAFGSSHVRLLMFIVGILLFESMQSLKFKQRLRQPGEILTIAYFVVSLVFTYANESNQAFFALLPAHQPFEVLPDFQMNNQVFRVFVLSTSCFLICLYAFAYDGILKRVLSWNLLRFWGNMSYSYYLIHGLTLKALALFLSKVIPHPSINSAILFGSALLFGLLLTWISASALFALVEKPMSLRKIASAQPQVFVFQAPAHPG